MPELVNATAKSQLSPRNQEPTHLGGSSYETLGGPGVTSEPNGADYKIDAEKGVTTDTSIPKAVPAEPTHLKGVSEDDDAEVSFDDDDMDDMDADDIDNELDSFGEADVEVSVDKDKLDEEDDEDEKKVDESDEDEDDEKKDVSEEAEADDEKKVDEDDESEDDKKKMDEADEDIEKIADREAVKEGDEDDEKKDDDLKESAVKIRIKMPAIKLHESVVPAKNQKKVAVLFEQHIKATTKQVGAQLHKHYKSLYEQKIARRDAAMSKQIDGYLSYVVEEWMKQNRVAVRTSLRTQLAEEFLTGLQKLMKEHYIDVPESKVNVVKKLQSEVAGLTKRLNEQTAKTMKVRKLAEEANKLRIVSQFSRGMSEAQAAKLQRLAENTKYTNSKDFKQKLSVLKESYFAKDKTKVKQLAEEAVVVPAPEKKKNETVAADPLVAAAVQTLKEQADRSRW